MLDRWLEPSAERLLNRWATLTLQSGMTPNRLTLISYGFAFGASAAAGMQAYKLALILMLLNRLFDGLAGMMARLSNVTPLGRYLDVFGDVAMFGLFIFFFSLGMNGTAMAAAFTLLAYLLMTTAWLASAIFRHEGAAPIIPRSLLVGNSETILMMIVCCLMPLYFPAFCTVIGMMCLADTIWRMMSVKSSLSAN